MTIQAANRKLKQSARPDAIMVAIRELSEAGEALLNAAETGVFKAPAVDRLVRDAHACKAAGRLLWEERAERMRDR